MGSKIVPDDRQGYVAPPLTFSLRDFAGAVIQGFARAGYSDSEFYAERAVFCRGRLTVIPG
jgi:hypothetical protein